MNTDKHYLWYLAGAEYIEDDYISMFGDAGGNGWVDPMMYNCGDGSAYLHVSGRALDKEIYNYGYRY